MYEGTFCYIGDEPSTAKIPGSKYASTHEWHIVKIVRIVTDFTQNVCPFDSIICVIIEISYIYRVIHKSLRDFRPLRYSSREGHAEGEHVNRGTGTPSFCPTLQVLEMSTHGDAADANSVIKFLPHTLHVWQELDYRIDICRVTKGGHIEHL